VQQSSEEILRDFGVGLPAQGLSLTRSFEELFTEHYPRLVKTLLRLTGDPGQSEELAAETFCKLYKRWPVGETGENPAGWLYKAAMNLGLDTLRANARRLRREERAGKEATRDDKSGGPLQELLVQEERERVRAVIAQLNPVHGQVLLMGSSGFSGKEMATLLGLKPDALYMLVARAKAQFEKKYVDLYGRQA
jgi:RNA polymerase sigma factor (sigma-70 family)